MAKKKDDVAMISHTTTVSLRVVGIIVVVVLGLCGLYYDLRSSNMAISHSIEQLREEILKTTEDRWTKQDDMWHMLRFCDRNKLECLPHMKVAQNGRRQE